MSDNFRPNRHPFNLTQKKHRDCTRELFATTKQIKIARIEIEQQNRWDNVKIEEYEK